MASEMMDQVAVALLAMGSREPRPSVWMRALLTPRETR